MARFPTINVIYDAVIPDALLEYSQMTKQVKTCRDIVNQ